MDRSPYEIFQLECPELAAKFNELPSLNYALIRMKAEKLLSTLQNYMSADYFNGRQ